jgi:hypothetical protein
MEDDDGNVEDVGDRETGQSYFEADAAGLSGCSVRVDDDDSDCTAASADAAAFFRWPWEARRIKKIGKSYQ